MSSERFRVLWMSDSPFLATGFGRVTREIVSRLSLHPRLELACLGWGCRNRTSVPGGGLASPITVYPSSHELWGQDGIEAALTEFKPHLVVSLGELRMIGWLAACPLRAGTKWLGYVPLDGQPFYPPWKDVLSSMDHLVAMSKFGRAVLASGMPGKEIGLIYHGVDPAVYRPLEDRDVLKRHPRFNGRFVVGCVARNQARKNQPALVQAFATLAARYPNLHLYLHSTPSPEGFDLRHLLKRHRLEGRADLASPDLAVGRAIDDVRMNQLYNLFDVMVLPTCAEGFGLPILESMAAGTPVIATDFSACSELLEGRGERVRVKTTIVVGENLVEQAIVDVDHLADCIEKLYLTPALREHYSRAGRAFAESLSWDRLMPSWFQAIGQTLDIELIAAVSALPAAQSKGELRNTS